MKQKRKPLIDTFVERNSKLNLSAIRDVDSIYTKHILDSIELNKKITLTPGSTLADVGTGWWFPLLPLAMTNPEVRCTGIDTRKKKTIAVQAMADELELKNVWVVWSRVEEVKQRFDYVTARAVWYADKIIPRCAPLVKKGWTLILYKVLSPEEEPVLIDLAEGKKLYLETMHYYKLFEEDIQRVIYIFTKE